MDDVLLAAKQVLKNCMGLKTDEEVLVVVDTPLTEMGYYFTAAARELGNEASILEYQPRKMSGQEPPQVVAQSMLGADVILLVTTKSLSHTTARQQASVKGARIVSMPGVIKEMLLGAMNLSKDVLDEMVVYGERYADILTKGKRVHLSTPGGTDLVFSIENRTGMVETGVNHCPGDFSNLPAGEAFIAPVEGSAEGTIVYDATVAMFGYVDQPVVIKVEKGIVVDIKGGKIADKLRVMLEDHDKWSRYIAELGIGLNPKAKICGINLQDEKVRGTVHIALGDNSTFGGKVVADSHIDGVMLKPTLKVDGITVMADGEWGCDGRCSQTLLG